jgi:hypothetical protein
VINYFYPGDEDLKSTLDPIAEEFGQGLTHSGSEIVERLVEFQYRPEGIEFSGSAPIQLQRRGDGEARNWEGIARLDDLGFLLVTDEHPETILGFVGYP